MFHRSLPHTRDVNYVYQNTGDVAFKGLFQPDMSSFTHPSHVDPRFLSPKKDFNMQLQSMGTKATKASKRAQKHHKSIINVVQMTHALYSKSNFSFACYALIIFSSSELLNLKRSNSKE